MQLNRREFHRLILASLTLAAPGLHADPGLADPGLIEGRDWAPVTPPQVGAKPDQIEVLEFFSYGCPHCRDLNPLVKRWAAGLGPEVHFRRVPVSFGRAAWANLTRLYYALEVLDELERLDQGVFDALHGQRKSLFTEQAITTWVAEQGVDPARFAEAFRSFEVEVSFTRAEALTRAYRVDGVPLLTVAGRYKVLSEGARTQADVLAIADRLIARTRDEQQTRTENAKG